MTVLPDDQVRVLDESGALTEDASGMVLPDPAMARELYRRLVLGRRFDEEATSLANQGRLAVYPSSYGQEACQVGAVMAIEDTDWIFPTYRDSVALVARGIDPLEVLGLFRGDSHCGYDPRAHRAAPHCAPLATQCPQAAGFACAAAYRNEDTVVLCLVGDGATSEGDFHEGLNIAAVFACPVVFLVQNNHYAISVPLDRQTRAPSLAHKGAGYGVPALRVDGNDVLAVWSVVREAADAARRGGGPALIEAVTYRVGPHTNADDPKRYRAPEEAAAWRERDPLTRYEAHLKAGGLLDEEVRTRVKEDADRLADRLRKQPTPQPPDPTTLFAHVYSERTPRLRAQEAMVCAESEGRA